MHTASKLRGGSLKMHDLRTSAKTLKGLSALFVPLGMLIIDEALQAAAPLYHALSLRSSYGRQEAHNLDLSHYADSEETFGAIPFVIECGDELQLPPVPATASFFAEETGSPEHAAGVHIFRQKHFVCRLTTMKRFRDPVQISVLTKMRTKGGCKLTNDEWKAVARTEITKLTATERQRRLENTELWYQAAPTWATVTMAQALRSRASAQVAQ